MGNQVKTEKPKTNKRDILGLLGVIGAGVWAVIEALSKKKGNGQNKS